MTSSAYRVVAAVVVASALIFAVYAGCPNACSGTGECGRDDMCVCWRNWMGADCSQRVCPYSYAHVSTPQGDLNKDGDLNDNSFRRIPSSNGFVKVTKLSADVTMTDAAGVATPLSCTTTNDCIPPNGVVEPAMGHTTLEVGDAVSINGEMFLVNTYTAGSSTFTITTTTPGGDPAFAVYNGETDSRAVAYKMMPNIRSPQGSWESWPGDFARAITTDGTEGAPVDEGHFYMECSNRGLCNRKEGLCECFTGYGGTACQRTVCPNDCSGHGTCEKVSELRKLEPVLITTCTVSGTPGALTLATDFDCASSFSAGDHILVGDTSTTYEVASVSATTITLATGEELKKAYPAGTSVFLQAAYSLWDADMGRACKCDSRYTGLDCSTRACPYGDDPMTLGQQFETQILTIGGADPQLVVGGDDAKLVGTTGIKLVFEDMYGEKWTTTQIPVNGVTDHSTELAAALTKLPNDVIEGVHVRVDGINSKGIRYYIKFDGGSNGPANCAQRKCIAYTATGNSGDLPAMGCDNSNLLARVEKAAIGGTAGSHTRTASSALKNQVQFHTAIPVTSLQVGHKLAFYSTGPTTWQGDGTVASRTISGSTITKVTVSTKMAWTDANLHTIKPVRYVTGSVECTVSDIAEMLPKVWASTYVKPAANENNLVDSGDAVLTAEVASGTLTDVVMSAAPLRADGTALAVGDIIRVYTSAIAYEDRIFASLSSATITVSAAFSAAISAGAVAKQVIAGSTSLTLLPEPTDNAVKIGDQLYIYRDKDNSQILTVADRVGADIITVEPITVAGDTDKVYLYGKGTNEKAVCSRRGLCHDGICTCFRTPPPPNGTFEIQFNLDDCSRQTGV